eukprot:1019653-Prymnesium_polylepis.1
MLREAGGELQMAEVDLSSKLCTAAAAGDAKTIARYLAAGGSPDAADYDKRVPLMISAADGSVSICKMVCCQDSKPLVVRFDAC